MTVTEAYAELSLTPDMPRDTMEQTLKSLMKTYHPDKHVNLSPQQRRHMEEKAKRVNQAWEIIKKDKGW